MVMNCECTVKYSMFRNSVPVRGGRDWIWHWAGPEIDFGVVFIGMLWICKVQYTERMAGYRKVTN